jgi:hypothetical protein
LYQVTLFGLYGRNPANLLKKSPFNFPVGFRENGVQFQKFSQVAHIFADNEKDELLGLFYDNDVYQKSNFSL